MIKKRTIQATVYVIMVLCDAQTKAYLKDVYSEATFTFTIYADVFAKPEELITAAMIHKRLTTLKLSDIIRMIMKIGSKALIPNPALKPFALLIGEWRTTGSHPYLPDTVLHGRASIEWLEGGAFLIFRSEIDEPRFPHGIEIFGSDDVAHTFYMLHFDERGISRKFDVAIHGNQIKWWRDESSFSQRCTVTIEDNGNKLVSKGEMSRDGAAWEKDLELTYTRVE